MLHSHLSTGFLIWLSSQPLSTWDILPFFSPQLCLIYFTLRFSSHCSTLDILSALLHSLVELLHWFSSRPLVIWVILPCVPLHPCRLEFLQLCSPPPRSRQPEIFTCCPSHPWQTEIFTWFSSNIYIYYLTWFYTSSHISTWDISPGSPPSHSRPGIFFLVLFLALVNMRYSPCQRSIFYLVLLRVLVDLCIIYLTPKQRRSFLRDVRVTKTSNKLLLCDSF